jgi:toxin-antitoxin system PIN domain toxin
VIGLDTNILVHAFRPDSPQHERAARAVNDRVAGGRRIAVPWPVVHEFLAVVTNRRVFVGSSPMGEALAAVAALTELDTVELLAESSQHVVTMTRLLETPGVTGPKVHDARIAAICIDHGVDELWTADRDFSYFPELTTRNPLV